jgi:hypothetical protein
MTATDQSSTATTVPVSLGAFAAEAGRFLDAHAARQPPQSLRWGEGLDVVGNTDERAPAEEEDWVRAAKQWKAVEFDAGFG